MEPAEFWSIGDYSVVGDLWAQAGRDVVASLNLTQRHVVDLACGTGVAALAAAAQGARPITGVDVTPSLLDEARRRAEAADLTVQWVEADMHHVPLPSGVADVVISTFGLVFSPEPATALTEARRLARPEGRVVFTSWAPQGAFGGIRQALAPYFPETPDPWHEDPEQIRAITGPEADISLESFTLEVQGAEQFVQQMEQHSAPIILGAQSLGETWPKARAALLQTVKDASFESSGRVYLNGNY